MTKPAPLTPIVPERARSFAIDVFIFITGLALFAAILSVAHHWLGPPNPSPPIDRSPLALPKYAGYSFLRIATAYLLSLVFALLYGYVAAYSRPAERFMIPLLDVLQSIPVLSFLPGVMLVMVGIAPHRQLGVELGAILLIFTGQAWNMAFSVYASLKSLPSDLRNVARIYHLNPWQRFTQLELPYATIGLVWNSMMSVAGGWFFLMACEMFVLGNRDFRLPGLGSYLQTAASAGDTPAILWGLGAMIGVVVALDQLVWRPVICWANKFKFEETETEAPHSPILDALRRSRVLGSLRRVAIEPLNERLVRRLAFRSGRSSATGGSSKRWHWLERSVEVIGICVIIYGVAMAVLMINKMSPTELHEVLRSAAATFARVMVALGIGTLWTIPVGVAIGFNTRVARVAQPVVQIAASVPATALFPVVLLLLIQVGGGLGVASVLLMLLGTQWYILFNVIAGAIAIPTDLKEASRVFRLGLLDRWRVLILPGIFPSLVTGLITAAGGAWNASIVAEYFHFKGQIISTTGLGATISRATDSGNFHQLLVATSVMVAIVVTTNRLVWRRLYRLAHTRFRLDT